MPARSARILQRTPAPLSRGDESGAATVSRVMGVVQQLRADFADRDALYQDIDAVLFGTVPIEIPEAYRKTALEVRSPLAIHMTNTVAAALSINPYTVQFRPLGFGDSATANATMRERFFEASWGRQVQESRRQLFRLFMWPLVAKGEAVLKTIERGKRAWASYDQFSRKLMGEIEKPDGEYSGFDQHAKDTVYESRTEEYKLAQPYPISTSDVPPETFYYLKGEDGFRVCVEVKQVPYYDALDRFDASITKNGQVVSDALNPHALGLPRDQWAQGMGGVRTLTMIEYWDWESCHYLLAGPGHTSSSGQLGHGTLVRSIKHHYGDPWLKTLKGPYFHAQGITTASRLPDRAGLSILFGFLRLFPILDTMLTVQGNAGIWTGFPAFKRTLPPGIFPGQGAPFGMDGTERDVEEVIEPGTIYPYDVSPIDQPRSGTDADKVIAQVRGFLELALPSVIQGVVTDQSGYALNQAAQLARLAWDPIVKNAEAALAERTGFESWMIETRIGERVYAWGEQARGKRLKGGWLGIGPDDLKGAHRYNARLDPETPSNKLLQIRALGEAMDKRLITYEDAVEQSGANADEVEKSWLLKDLKESPEIQSKIKERVFQRLGVLQAQRIQQSGGIPDEQSLGVGNGPEGNVFAPGQGMPLLPTPRGSVTGMGPGGGPGGLAGAPVQPGIPAAHLPLPGQA